MLQSRLRVALGHYTQEFLEVYMFAVVIFGAASMVALIPVFTLGYVLRAPWSLTSYFGGFMKLAAWPMGWVQDEMERA